MRAARSKIQRSAYGKSKLYKGCSPIYVFGLNLKPSIRVKHSITNWDLSDTCFAMKKGKTYKEYGMGDAPKLREFITNILNLCFCASNYKTKSLFYH